MIYPIVRLTILPLIRLFFIKKVTGLNNIPKKGPFIIVANHTSFLDPGVLFSVLIPRTNQKIHFIANIEHTYWHYFPKPVKEKWVGSIPVGKGKRGKLATLKKAIRELEKGGIVGIMPEAGRSPDGELMKAKTGAARLALWSKVPVIPIGIKNAFKVWPKQKTFPKLKKIVEIRIGEPINLKRYYKKRISYKLLQNITRVIMKNIAKLINKKYKF